MIITLSYHTASHSSFAVQLISVASLRALSHRTNFIFNLIRGLLIFANFYNITIQLN